MPDTHRSSSGGFSSGVSDVAAAAVDERRPAKEEERTSSARQRAKPVVAAGTPPASAGSQSDDAGSLDLKLPPPPRLAISFELWADPLDENQPLPGRLKALQEELAVPHSMLQLRLKDKLERAIASHAQHGGLHPVGQRNTLSHTGGSIVASSTGEDSAASPKAAMRHTLQGVMGLRAIPRDAGGSFMMRGPRPEQAAFVGHRNGAFGYTSLADDLPFGMQHVTLDKEQRPALYQPFRDMHERKRDLPVSHAPSGRLVGESPDGPLFALVRHN
mmetsp:Transcript_21713/g.49411  ORF Transcript_21713/g.49411 Transcript_21713/m.49411 type:complete len:273 (+) Transcript_21713:96-914(+)